MNVKLDHFPKCEHKKMFQTTTQIILDKVRISSLKGIARGTSWYERFTFQEAKDGTILQLVIAPPQSCDVTYPRSKLNRAGRISHNIYGFWMLLPLEKMWASPLVVYWEGHHCFSLLTYLSTHIFRLFLHAWYKGTTLLNKPIDVPVTHRPKRNT